MNNKQKISNILVLIDAEVYERQKFKIYIDKCREQILNIGGAFIFEGIAPEIIESDWKPRNTFLIMKWESEDQFRKWWISAEHRALRYEQKEASDLKVAKIQLVTNQNLG